ncbi:MAG: hypothetical protein K2Q26_03440 [Bdellovibrionales bacterium]|nr:hypothetical protein [Bdellovibrionales bacterium]
MRKRIVGIAIVCLAGSPLLFQNCSKKNTSKSNISASRTLASQTDSPESGVVLKSSVYTDMAQDIYQRITGVNAGLDNREIQEMSQYLENGNKLKAAEIAMQNKNFLNITVRDMATRLSTREANTLAPLSDFVATVIGVTRDNVNAKELLTGNFYYRAVDVPGVPQDIVADIIKSNNHYNALDTTGANLSAVLVREDGQKIIGASGQVEVLSDAAGLLTTRAFMEAHAKAGTNRRIIEYTFKMFLCSPIQTWASTSRPDFYIGRDVGRNPSTEFNNKCKSCHSGMDAMRPATAHFDFFVENEAQKTGFIKFNYDYKMDPRDEDATKIDRVVPDAEQKVPYKFRRGSSVYPDGFKVKNNSWSNYVPHKNFGWKTPLTGQGMNELGQMVASSEKYAECLVQNVFYSVCRRNMETKDASALKYLTSQLISSNYNLQHLYKLTVLSSECLGID